MKHKIHRFYKGAIILAGTGIVLLAALYLLRGILIAPHIQRFLEKSITSQLGMEVAIGNIDGSYITGFEVMDVTTAKPASEGVLVSLELKRLRVAYNLLSILEGLDDFIGKAAIEIEAATLRFDMSRQDAGESGNAETLPSSSIYMPPRLPQISIRDASVLLRGSDYETIFTGIALETRLPRQTTNAIVLRVADWTWNHPDLQPGKTPLSVEIEYSAEKIIAKHLMLGTSELAQSLQIGLKDLPGIMPFEAILHPAGGNLALAGRLDHSDLQARVTADNIDLAPIGAFFSSPGIPLSGRLSMTADVFLPQLQPTGLVADLDLNLTQGAVYGVAVDKLAMRAASKEGKLRLDQLNLQTGENTIDIADASTSLKAVLGADVAGILKAASGRFSMDWRDVPAFFSHAGVDLPANVDAVPPHILLLEGMVAEGGDIILTGGSLTAESGYIRLEPSRITMPSGGHPIEDTAVQATLDIAFSNLEQLGQLFAIPGLGGSMRGHATVAGTFSAPSGTADIEARQLSFLENQFGNADIRLHANGRKITVETLKLRQAKDRVDLEGAFDLTSRNFEKVRLDIDIADLGDYTKSLPAIEQSINASIRANLKMSGPLMEPEARADITLTKIRLNDVQIPSATFQLHSSGRRVHIDLAKVDVPPGQVTLAGNILRGPVDADFDMELTDLRLSGENVSMTLAKPGYLHFSRAGELTVKDISLAGPSGGIRIQGALSAWENADFTVAVSDFNSNGWLEALVTDPVRFSGLNANIRLFDTVKRPSFTVTGDLAKLDSSKDGFSLSGRFDLAYTNTGLIVRQFQWQGQPGQEIVLTGVFPVNLLEKPILKPGPLSIDAQISIPDLGAFGSFFPAYIPSDGDFQGQLQMAGTWEMPTGAFVFQSRGLNDPPHMQSMPPGPIGVDGNIRLDGNKLTVTAIQINAPKLTFTSRGEWTGMPSLIELIQGETGKPAGNVAVKGKLSVADLSWLAAENPNLRRVAGRLEADVTMEGPISDPVVDADVRLTDGELRPDMDVPSLQALNLNAVVTPAGTRLQTFTGELGGAAFQVTGSVLHNSESGAAADLRLRGDNLLFYRSEGLKVRADTDLTVKGPLERLEVAGEVAITDGRLLKYFDILGTLKGSSKPKVDMGIHLFSFKQPPFRDMVFDVRLTSKNPFVIRNNLARGAVRPELTLTGSGQFPVLAGNVYVDPTRISLPAGRLVFESGVIRFDPNRPDRPVLDLIGTSKMLGYDVTMLVEGPYDEPIVTLSSTPPLSNEELLMLLIAGQQPKATNDAKASQRQSVNVAIFLGRDLIARWFGRESAEADEPILDRFEIGVGRAITRAGDETIDTQFRIADDVLRDGDKLYITGERDRFDFYNAGVKIVFRFQ